MENVIKGRYGKYIEGKKLAKPAAKEINDNNRGKTKQGKKTCTNDTKEWIKDTRKERGREKKKKKKKRGQEKWGQRVPPPPPPPPPPPS